MTYAYLLAFAYLLGAVPFGVLVSRAHGVDLSKVGSGNIGATNVSRALGPAWALAVLALDVGKGALPALLAYRLIEQGGQLHSLGVGLAAVVGHCASPFLRFRGGKGIATGLGALLGSAPLVALLTFGVFLIAFSVCRYVSLSSMLAAFALPLIGWLMRDPPPLIATYAGLFVFILYRHRANVARLVRGEEPKFTFRGGGGSSSFGKGEGEAAGADDSAVKIGTAQTTTSEGEEPLAARDPS